MKTDSSMIRPVPALLPEDASWQACVTFPDRFGFVCRALPVNSSCSYAGCAHQGYLYISVSENVQSFDMFVNGRRIGTEGIREGTWRLCTADLAADGRNTLQVMNIEPPDLKDAVRVYIPFPVITEGCLSGSGIRPEAFHVLDELIKADLRHGFPSASLTVIRRGRVILQKEWGTCDASDPDSSDVTADTLYDLASVTKMFAVNYPLQKLAGEGKVQLDNPVCRYLGDAFLQDVTDIPYKGCAHVSPETQKEWKRKMTLRHLLTHRAGYPADARYYYRHYDAAQMRTDPKAENVLYAGKGADAETRQKTAEAIFRTPLMCAPDTRTLYSDTDYMILGLVIEAVTGMDPDTCLKEMFLKPLGLTHMTFEPLKHGFSKEDCAAAELHGNTRDGYRKEEGLRTYTLRGEVHDEKAYYSMAGVSGHAGLFASSHDAAVLAAAMLYGGIGTCRFFDPGVPELFASPAGEDGAWGLGWFRNGGEGRPWFFGTNCSSRVIGHHGWTGTMIMIDPEKDLVTAYLTNAKNTPVTDPEKDPNVFDGDWFTASGTGIVPQLLYTGIDTGEDLTDLLFSMICDMASESIKCIPEGASADHPAVRNAMAKAELTQIFADTGARKQKAEELHVRLLHFCK